MGLIVDNFAGGGGASTGIELALGRNVDIAINHDPAAILMHKTNHPYTKHYKESVWDIDIREVTKGKEVDLAWFSPDCFPEGTLVLTKEGYRPIETIKVGDFVLTHKQRWRKVTETSNAIKQLVTIKGHGHYGLSCSLEHPFYAKKRTNKWNNDIRQYRSVYDNPEWVPASVMDKGWYWSTPTNIPKLEILEMPKDPRGTTLNIDEKLMWLAGRYVGDGWTRLTDTRAELVIVCGKHEARDLSNTLDKWSRTGERVKDGELSWTSREVRTAVQFSTNSKALVKWLRDNFGHGAGNKGIPAWLYGADMTFKQAFLDGYVSADGCLLKLNEKDVVEINTISKALAFGIKQLISTMGKVGTIYINDKPNKIIEGRKVNSKTSYMVRWRMELDKHHNQTFIEEGLLWSSVKGKSTIQEAVKVFNIGVDEDESYVAEGIVVHNCKHFSKAKGGKPVNKEIRGLAWVAIKWAGTVRPKVIMLENVEEFQTWGPIDKNGRPKEKDKGKTFRSFINAFKHLGYEVDYRELVAADYGAPTTRKRFFLIARCDGKPIVWPEPTHGEGLKPYIPASSIIDWSIPVPSIFDREKPLVDNTLIRISRGIQKFVIEEEPYIVNDTAYFLSHYYTHQGSETRGSSLREPIATIPTQNRFGLVSVKLQDINFPIKDGVAAFLTKYYSGPVTGQSLNEPIHTITTKDRFGLVVVRGKDYKIADIGLRMLTARELFNGMGFPKSYIIERDYTGKRYPTTQQKARCGNAVVPILAKALVQANLPEQCKEGKSERVG